MFLKLLKNVVFVSGLRIVNFSKGMKIMARKRPNISFGNLKGSGIVAVLFIIGFLVHKFTNLTGLGEFAMFASVLIGLVYGVLGIFGILKKNRWI